MALEQGFTKEERWRVEDTRREDGDYRENI